MNIAKHLLTFAVFLALSLLIGTGHAAGLVESTDFGGDTEIVVHFRTAVDQEAAQDVARYTVFEETDPDIRLTVSAVELSADGMEAVLRFAEPLNTTVAHVVSVHGLGGVEETTFSVSKSYLGYLVSILISALLINNFVFTKYLGLCVFFGTSKRKETAKGMGVVFTVVIVVSVTMSWFLYQYVLKPFNLDYLQIVIFIGLTSLTVQAVDTVLRKVNPILFKSFGVYLVLVIANCIIIAVPLLMASNEYNYFETFMLSLGAGGGFLLALYLMSAVRERVELARVPESFKGLPIAFIVAGQFAMAFLGFSGLQLF